MPAAALRRGYSHCARFPRRRELRPRAHSGGAGSQLTSFSLSRRDPRRPSIHHRTFTERGCQPPEHAQGEGCPRGSWSPQKAHVPRHRGERSGGRLRPSSETDRPSQGPPVCPPLGPGRSANVITHVLTSRTGTWCMTVGTQKPRGNWEAGIWVSGRHQLLVSVDHRCPLSVC